MERKKICLISPKFSNYIGGMETHAYEFSRAFLSDEEYPISHIFIKRIVTDGIAAPQKEESQDSTKVSIGIESVVSATPYLQPVLTEDFEKDAKALVENCDPEKTIYFFNSPTWLPSVEYIKHWYPRARVMVRSGGNDIVAGWVGDERKQEQRLEDTRRRLVNLVNTHVDYLIVNSEYSRERTEEVGVDKRKIAKVIGGVDCNLFYPGVKPNNHENTLNILTAARLVKFKGFEYALQAIQKLLETEDKQKIKYSIVGEGPERVRIEEYCRNHNLENVVSLAGARSIEDMPSIFRKAYLFLHMPVHLEKQERGSSYIHTETMGRCLCEAQASGLPVVATRVGGVPEIVEDNVTGFLVPEKDYITAADCLSRLVKDHELRQKMARNARNRVEELFDWSIVFKQYKELFV